MSYRFQDWYDGRAHGLTDEELARAAWNAAVDAAADKDPHLTMSDEDVQRWRTAFGNHWKEELSRVWRFQSSVIRTLKD